MNIHPPLFGQRCKASAVLHQLTHALRVLSDEQVGRIWYPNCKRPKASARALFRRLEAKESAALHTGMVRELSLTGPVFSWKPGDPWPQFGRLAYLLKSRWTGLPKWTVVARATSLARQRLGGPLGGRALRPHEVAHDLGLSAVYFRLLETIPDLSLRWRHEDELWQSGAHLRGDPIPDAVLLGSPEVVIEFGGEYGAEKLALVHRHYHQGHYEVW